QAGVVGQPAQSQAESTGGVTQGIQQVRQSARACHGLIEHRDKALGLSGQRTVTLREAGSHQFRPEGKAAELLTEAIVQLVRDTLLLSVADGGNFTFHRQAASDFGLQLSGPLLYSFT